MYLIVGPSARRRQLEQIDAVEIPSVRLRDGHELGRRFRKRDIKRPLATSAAGQEELERERRLACTRVALNQMQALGGKTALEQMIETGDTH